VAAYEDLFAEGYLEGRHGSGTYVVDDLPTLPRPERPRAESAPRWAGRTSIATVEEPIAAARIEFRLGQPSLSTLSPAVWRGIWRAVGERLPPTEYGAPAGEPSLRLAVARYLARSRGVACDPDDVVITSGAIQA